MNFEGGNMIKIKYFNKTLLINPRNVAGACKIGENSQTLRITFMSPTKIWNGRSRRFIDLEGKSLKWLKNKMEEADE